MRPEAAVSIIKCLLPRESILLLRRKKNPRDPWSGHFAFPGGRREVEDETIFATCLRETYEETGIMLDDTLLRTKFNVTPAGRNVQAPILVQPFLFELESRPSVTIETAEIESYFWLETARFRDKKQHTIVEVLPARKYPVYPLDDYYLWGFTYGLLCSLLDIDFDL